MGVMSHEVVPAMLCYAMLCYAMLCYAMRWSRVAPSHDWMKVAVSDSASSEYSRRCSASMIAIPVPCRA
jgi:hypothetical protein